MPHSANNRYADLIKRAKTVSIAELMEETKHCPGCGQEHDGLVLACPHHSVCAVFVNPITLELLIFCPMCEAFGKEMPTIKFQLMPEVPHGAH